jgi:hypothetical protein
MARRSAIAAALLAGMAVALWLLRAGNTSSVPPVVLEVEPAKPRSELPTAPQRALRLPETHAAQSEPVPVETPVSGEPADDVFIRRMADQAYSYFGQGFVDHLVRQGLPRTDSEAIVTELMLAGVACSLETLEEQAAAQGVSVNEIRSAAEVAFNAPDSPPVVAGVDVRRVFEHVMHCAFTALERSGIPPATAMQLLRAEYD